MTKNLELLSYVVTCKTYVKIFSSWNLFQDAAVFTVRTSLNSYHVGLGLALPMTVKRSIANNPITQMNKRGLAVHTAEDRHSLPSKSGLKNHSSKKSDIDLFREETIASYTHCLSMWAKVHFKVVLNEDKQNLHLKKILSEIPLAKLPKAFKGMLCDRFSIELKQERPSVPISGRSLFYSSFDSMIWRFSNPCKRRPARIGRQRKLLTVFWDLKDCKSLAKEVHESFVKEALLDHSKILSEVHCTDPGTLNSFVEFCEPWIQSVVSNYDVERAYVPSTHASLETPRSKGGLASSLQKNLFSEEKRLVQPSCPRIDPTCVLLSGAAGCGKSLIQSLIGQLLAKRLGKTVDQTLYSRNSVMDHWDGYKHQPLVILDDFRQVALRSSSGMDTEATEFITLNSTADYRLPMADLREKGEKFTSPLILLSSNMTVGSAVHNLSRSLLTADAIYRRFSDCFELERQGKTYILYRATMNMDVWNKERSVQQSRIEVIRSEKRKDIAIYILDVMMSSWQRKSLFYNEFFCQDRFRQYLHNDEVSVGYSYPVEPTSDNTVRVAGVIEPLKVRTITVGTCENFALKGLQKTMLNSLRDYPCMAPCFSPDYLVHLQNIEDKSPKDTIWLSGDYSSATDGLHSDLQRSLLGELSRRLEGTSNAVIIPYLLKEMGEHNVRYPKEYGIPDTLQTNGQLMGSLLSFPVLCLANAFAVCRPNGWDLKSLPGLIHGDDLLMKAYPNQIQAWKDQAREIGLALSMGKNYESPWWGSIDSQIYTVDQGVVSLDHVGKFKCFGSDAVGAVVGLLRRQIPLPIVVSSMKSVLARTPQSVDVSNRFGGLNPSGSEPVSKLDHCVAALTADHRLRCRQQKLVKDKFVMEISPDLLNLLPLDRLRQFKVIELTDSLDQEPDQLWKSVKTFSRKGKVSFDVDYESSVFAQDRVSGSKTYLLDNQQRRLLKNLQNQIRPFERKNEMDEAYFKCLRRLNGRGDC